MNRRYSRMLSVFLVLIFLTGCAGSPSPTDAPLTQVTVQLSWTHHAEFAGLYAAEQQGYFAAEGLQVSFLQGGPEVDFIVPVADGTVQFGVAQPADVILARAAGKPLRTIAVFYRRSPIAFFSLADSGISRPQDFVGRQIRSTRTIDQTLRAMMSKVGVTEDQYVTVYLPSDVALFASGEVPVWGGFVNGVILEVQRAGHELNLVYPDDYGIHFYADVLITTDDVIAQNPDLALRFLRAALKGWTWAVENSTEVGALVQIYRPEADTDLEIAKMTASIPLVNTGEDFIGWMKPEIWTGMEKTLREQGILTAPLDITQVYTLQFLEEIYKK